MIGKKNIVSSESDRLVWIRPGMQSVLNKLNDYFTLGTLACLSNFFFFLSLWDHRLLDLVATDLFRLVLRNHGNILYTLRIMIDSVFTMLLENKQLLLDLNFASLLSLVFILIIRLIRSSSV